MVSCSPPVPISTGHKPVFSHSAAKSRHLSGMSVNETNSPFRTPSTTCIETSDRIRASSRLEISVLSRFVRFKTFTVMRRISSRVSTAKISMEPSIACALPYENAGQFSLRRFQLIDRALCGKLKSIQADLLTRSFIWKSPASTSRSIASCQGLYRVSPNSSNSTI